MDGVSAPVLLFVGIHFVTSPEEMKQASSFSITSSRMVVLLGLPSLAGTHEDLVLYRVSHTSWSSRRCKCPAADVLGLYQGPAWGILDIET